MFDLSSYQRQLRLLQNSPPEEFQVEFDKIFPIIEAFLALGFRSELKLLDKLSLSRVSIMARASIEDVEEFVTSFESLVAVMHQISIGK